LECDSALAEASLLLREGKYPLVTGRTRIAYGDRIMDWVVPVNEKSIDKYDPPHQTTFIRRDIYKKFLYDTSYRCHGDLDYWARLRNAGLFKPKFTWQIISVCRLGGISSKPQYEIRRLMESRLIKRRYGGEGAFAGFADAITGLNALLVKNLSAYILGDDRYYRWVLFNAYKIKSRLLTGRRT
jgi:hypothetical protein